MVTWTIPVPAGSQIITGVGNDIFSALDVAAGGGAIPPGFPQHLGSNIVEVNHPVPHDASPADPSASVKSSLDDLIKWEGIYGIPLTKPVQAVFEEYFKGGRQVYASLVQHPAAPGDGLGYSFCTCSLQRGVVFWESGQEQLYVRSTFHSFKDTYHWGNFQPRAGIKVSFPSNVIWFPLKLNRVLPASPGTAFLVLDILTPSSLAAIPAPNGFKVDSRGSVTVAGKAWRYVRLRRTYQAGDRAPIDDLALPPPAKH